MSFNRFPFKRYPWAWRIARMFPFAIWALAAAGGTAFLFGFWPGVLALLLVGIVLWIFPLHWFSLWFRSLAWRAARSAGAIYRHLRRAWLFVLFAVAALSWVLQLFYPERLTFAEHPAAVLSAALLLAVLSAMYQARKRIVIQSFIDFTVPSKEQGQGETIASRLRSEMAAVTELYKVIDEMSAPQASVVEATVTVEDVGEVLKEAIGPDSKISVKGLEIPLRAVIGPFSWLARGPRLTGSLHKDGDDLVLVAELQGGGLSGSWRVSSRDRDDDGWDPDAPGWRQTVSSSTDSPCAIPHLARQLAYRIVTDLVNLGSRRWRAVRQYTDGLCAYRDTRSTQREDKLLQAERAFVRALGHDDQFSQCHYNLGIVYRDTGKLAAARAAFQRALQANPASFAAAYAIAKDHFDTGRFEESVSWCDAAIRIDARDARAWKLKGWAMRRQMERKDGAPLRQGKWPAIVPTRDIAAALAWQTLCRQAAGPVSDGQATWIAAAATLNSGIGHCLAGEPARARRRFRQMLRLDSNQPVLRLEMGKTWCQAGNWEQGKRDLEPLCWEELVPADQAALYLYRLSADDALRRSEPWSNAEEKRKSEHRRLLDLVVALRDGQGAFDRMNWIEDVEGIRKVQTRLLEERKEEEKDSFIESVEVAWYLLAGLRRREGEDHEACAARLAALDRRLEEQREEVLADLSCLPGLGDHRSLFLFQEDAPTDRCEHASARQPRLREQAARCRLDLDWLLAQVKVRLAQERLDEEIIPARRALLAEPAARDLQRAIDILETARHKLQVRKQGLYSLRAEACLAMAAHTGDGTAEQTARTALLHRAMEYAERAVSHEPEGFRQRAALGRAHAAFKDYMQAEHELTTSLQLKHTASAAVSLAQVCWDRGSCLEDKESRKLDLGLARRTLDTALRVAEVGPEEQQVQVHGGIHFLLGMLYGDPSTPTAPVASHGGSSARIESGSNCDNAIYHLKIARSMGYKPIESHLVLGWTYFDHDHYQQAGEMFREAMEQAQWFLAQSSTAGAHGEHAAGRYPAQAPGEDLPVDELLAEALLGRALVFAERDTQMKLARLLSHRALLLLRHVENRARERKLRALYQECRGRILFHGHDLARGGAALKRAAALDDSPRVREWLAKVSSPAMAGKPAGAEATH